MYWSSRLAMVGCGARDGQRDHKAIGPSGSLKGCEGGRKARVECRSKLLEGLWGFRRLEGSIWRSLNQ